MGVGLQLRVYFRHVYIQGCRVGGGRMAGVYVVKYAGKAEKISLVETVHPDDNEVTEYLKTRILGACMAYYRHNGGKVAELHHDVVFFPCEFEASSHMLRPLWHQKIRSAYPHALRFLSWPEKFFFSSSGFETSSR